jgi:hypothetical protein
MLLIGSRALEHQAPDLVRRVPSDYDLIATYDQYEAWVARNRKYVQYCAPADAGKKFIVRLKTTNVEVEIAWEGSTAASLLALVEGDDDTRRLDEGLRIPSLNVLYTLKKSHRFLKDSPHFLKTMRDYRVLRAAGATVPERYAEWYRAREKETYSYGHPNLMQSKAGFFSGDGVTYVYDHDTIHLAMARGQAGPAYLSFKRPDADVACDRALFEAAPEEIKLNSVVEEAMVLALERSHIPFPGVLTPKQAFKTALMKVCTSITSGWWREYAYENYDAVLGLYDDSYVDRFRTAVLIGLVKRIGE